MSILECTFNPEQKRRALEQVLQGNTFSRADQLKRFLRYICEMEIAGRAHEIKEYSIATEALGRSAAYSPGDGSSVRSRALSLRQKLQEFYETENPEAEIRIELHKGSYIPCFVERSGAGRPPEAPLATPVKAGRRFRFAFGADAITALVIGAAALILVIWPRMSKSPDPDLQETWGPMLRPGAEVVICLGSPPALLLKSVKDGVIPLGTNALPAPEPIATWYAGLRMMDGGGKLYMASSLNTVLTGDALAAVRAVRVLTNSGASIQVLPESGLRPLVLRGRNVLLIGSPNYSPYAGRVLRGTPFSVYFDPATREEVIADGPPGAGAKQVFRPKRDEFGQMTQVYGLLTVVPSQASSDKKEQTVIFSGITSAGPQAAMEFFSSGPDLKGLSERFRQEGHFRLPSSYQVVVRCGVDRLLALTWAYETHRVISHPLSFD